MFFIDTDEQAKLNNATNYMRRLIPRKEGILKSMVEYLYVPIDRISPGPIQITFKRSSYQGFQTLFTDKLEHDIASCQQAMAEFKNVEEVEEFKKDWDLRLGAGRNDSDVFKETKKKIQIYGSRIERIPDQNRHFESITLVCEPLKKQLAKIPKEIDKEINLNFKSCLMEDMRQLKEELSKTQETLD